MNSFESNDLESFVKMSLKSDGTLIRFIKNPSVDIQIIAIKNNPIAITYIDNPDKKAIDVLVDDYIRCNR